MYLIGLFKIRKPWAAALVAFVLSPIFGMCYLNKGRLAVAYLAAYIVVFAAAFLAAPSGILKSVDPYTALDLPLIVGIIHCYVVARRERPFGAPKWYARWQSIGLMIVLPLMLAMYTRICLFQPFNIPNNSMSPSVNDGDYLFANKIAFINVPPQRGDIVIFTGPAQDNIYFIKRIAGLPGDRIEMKAGMLFINGNPIPHAPAAPFALNNAMIPRFTETLPDGSRYGILQETTDGPLDNMAPITVPPHQYFVLGDNRDQSNDSRNQSGVGFVPADKIVGKACTVLWNAHGRKVER